MNIEKIGDIKVSLEHWKCECKTNFVHSFLEDNCKKCKSNK